VRVSRDILVRTGILPTVMVALFLGSGCSSSQPRAALPEFEPLPTRPLPLPDTNARPGDVQLDVADDWSHLVGLWTTYAVAADASYRVNLIIQRNGESRVMVPKLGCQAKLELFRVGAKSIRINGKDDPVKESLTFALSDVRGGRVKLPSWIKVNVSVNSSPGQVQTQKPSGSLCEENNRLIVAIDEEDGPVYVELAHDGRVVAGGALQRAREVPR
jgi:hypothetical protein